MPYKVKSILFFLAFVIMGIIYNNVEENVQTKTDSESTGQLIKTELKTDDPMAVID